MSKTPMSVEDQTKFENVEKLLRSMAFKACGRFEDSKIMGADYDDCYGEMLEGYVKALNGFKPEMGWRFSTYLVTTCWNHFNQYFKRIKREHDAIGHISIEAISEHNKEDSSFNLLDTYESEELTPEVRLMQRQVAAQNAKRLSNPTKLVVQKLLNPDQELLDSHISRLVEKKKDVTDPRVVDKMTVSFICEHYSMDKTQIKRIKSELGRVYGIEEWSRKA